MPTVAEIITRQPQHYQARYRSAYWINWINDLLEDLSSEGFLMPSIKKEIGVVVADDVWIAKPTGMREIKRIYYPGNRNIEYTYMDIEDKIKLLNVEVSEAEDPDTATAFSGYAVGSMSVNISDAAVDAYKDFLLVITAGTAAGQTIIVSKNDVAALGYTKLYFRHNLKTVLSGTAITACKLIPQEDYVMMEYSSSYAEVSVVGDEIPIDDKFERRITKAWLRWKTEEETDTLSKETSYHERQYETLKAKLKMELRSNAPTRIPPRYIPGLSQYQSPVDEYTKEYESEI